MSAGDRWGVAVIGTGIAIAATYVAWRLGHPTLVWLAGLIGLNG